MTVVTIWINREKENEPSLWVASDTLLSLGKDKTTYEPLMECGAKIFSIPVIICKSRSLRTFEKAPYFSTTVGMAFAGSSLIPVNLYAFISYCFSSLTGSNNVIPSLEDLAQYVNKVFKLMIDNYCNRCKEAPKSCEVSIFGYCHETEKYRVFHMSYSETEHKSDFEEIDNIEDMGRVFIMGIKEIESFIKEKRDNEKDKILQERAPALVIKDFIIERIERETGVVNEKKRKKFSEKEYKIQNKIGGWVQLGVCNLEGFRRYVLVDEGIHKIQGLSIDCGEPIAKGQCFFAPFGMW